MRARSIVLSVCGMAAALLAWRLAAAWLPAPAGASRIGVRLGAAAAALLPAMFVLSAMILAQIAARFVSGTLDPTAGRDGRFLLLNQRAISNTVEQLTVFAPALLALAAAATAVDMPGVLALGPVFALARLVFWAGYLLAPIARAPGMAATGAVNVATLFAAAWFWLG
jgi:hypothetical protein